LHQTQRRLKAQIDRCQMLDRPGTQIKWARVRARVTIVSWMVVALDDAQYSKHLVLVPFHNSLA
jgi:hypothetical protein